MSRQIWSALLTARSTLLIQKYNKNQQISQWCYQTLPCLELVPATPGECPCLPTGGCIILKSRHPLPNLITGIDRDLTQNVTSLDGTVIFDPTTFSTRKYAVGEKYVSKKPQYIVYNEYLYVTVLTKLKAITITSLFEDPIEVAQFPSLCEEACDCFDIYSMEFPLDRDTMRTAIDMVVSELIELFTQMQQDDRNDSVDEASGGKAMVHQPPQQQQ